MKIIYNLSALLLPPLYIYFLLSFFIGEWNCINWSDWARFVALITSPLVTVLLMLKINEDELNS